jgi:methionine-rich copper-binding protein CopC
MVRLRLVIVCSMLLAPPAALAHAYLVKSVPAQRAVLYRAPAKIQLWFNERLEPRYSSLFLTNSDGKAIDLGPVEIGADDPKRLSAAVKPLPAGRYTVKFRVLSVDGHVVQDQFSFTIRQ